ncbi:MAG: SAM-dependent methyltransferase [Bacteroidales bacterium]|jgi:16S rRNA (cytidine1402-2'-O)-methyltransferase|nr:SAM-dependent methyltransferase [Bacteroidales bacterium]
MSRLFLLPALLGDESNPEDVLPANYKLIIAPLRTFVVENIRSARRFLRKAGFTAPFEDVAFHILDEHTSALDIPAEAASNDIGLLSEAGLPCIADPGTKMVQWALQHGMKIVPVSGPSSIFLALMASGLNGQNFCFHGYLPVNPSERERKIQSIENHSLSVAKLTGIGSAEIFIETPYRNKHLFASLLKVCKKNTMLCLAQNMTLPSEKIETYSTGKWKTMTVELPKQNAIFLLQAQHTIL